MKYDNGYEEKQIQPKKIRRRWFRNFYVLEQCKGWVIYTFTMEAGKFDPFKYSGTYYGPFISKKEADECSEKIDRYHMRFIMG